MVMKLEPPGGARPRRAIPEMPRSLASVAAQYLETEIIEGRLRPGARLLEEEWAERFGISRGSFREVLRILEASKLVEIVPRKGAQVATLNRRDVEEIYLLRKTLFRFGYEHAADKMQSQHLDRLREITVSMKAAVQAKDTGEFTRLSQLFDDTVLEVADILRLRMLIEFLGKQTIRYRYIGFKLPGQIERSLEAHQRILDAFVRGDGRTAGEVVYNIIERAGDTILSLAFKDTESAAGD